MEVRSVSSISMTNSTTNYKREQQQQQQQQQQHQKQSPQCPVPYDTISAGIVAPQLKELPELEKHRQQESLLSAGIEGGHFANDCLTQPWCEDWSQWVVAPHSTTTALILNGNHVS